MIVFIRTVLQTSGAGRKAEEERRTVGALTGQLRAEARGQLQGPCTVLTDGVT